MTVEEVNSTLGAVELRERVLLHIIRADGFVGPGTASQITIARQSTFFEQGRPVQHDLRRG